MRNTKNVTADSRGGDDDRDGVGEGGGSILNQYLYRRTQFCTASLNGVLVNLNLTEFTASSGVNTISRTPESQVVT